jgi:hypothetical protein
MRGEHLARHVVLRGLTVAVVADDREFDGVMADWQYARDWWRSK